MRTGFRSFLVILCSVVALGCTQDDNATKRIGIVLFGDARLPQTEGFIQGLSMLGYREGINVQYSIANAKNQRAKLPELVSQLKASRVDLMVATGGLEADEIKAAFERTAVPSLVLYSNSIVERGLVDTRAAPGWEVTGIDNLNAELSGKRLELLQTLVPKAKRVLVLYQSNIDPSRIGVEGARRAAANLGIKIDARSITTRDEIEKTMAKLRKGEVDAMLTVPSAAIDDAFTDLILPHLRRLKLPVMTHSRSLAEAGAVASYGAPPYSMGQQAARLADKILRGVIPSKIPFELPKQYVYTINVTSLRELDLDLNSLAKSQVNDFVKGGSA